MIFKLFQKYKAVILYLFFGGCTTVINIVTYFVCDNYLSMGNIPSNIVAWVLAVVVAYVTNKIWVFESRCSDRKELIKEMANFFNCRILTGVVDLLIMYIGVDILHYNNLVIKVLANIFVFVSNYIASKVLIFKNTTEE